MKIWVVCWIGEGNTPCMDAFGEIDKALNCLNYLVSSGKTAVVKTVNIQIEPPEKQEEKMAENNEVKEEEKE